MTKSFVARLAGLLPAVMLLFVAAAFALPNKPAYSDVFYIAVLPCLLAQVWSGKVPGVMGDRALSLAVALIAFSALSLAWGRDDGGRSLRFLFDSVMTLAFLLACVSAFQTPASRERLARLLAIAGGLNAVLAIVLGFLTPQDGPRMHGWGAARHPILGAHVMDVAFLTAMWRFYAGRGWWNLLAAVPMVGFVLLTESRGPLLACMVAWIFLAAIGRWRWRALPIPAACVAIWFALPTPIQQHAAQVVVARGTSRHIDVWKLTLAQIAERPIFGHGLAANISTDKAITFPHDLYLSVIFYTGIAGFLIFAAFMVVLTWRLLQRLLDRSDAEAPWLAALWVNAGIAGITDVGQITKGPDALWFFFWLPAALQIASYPIRNSRAPFSASQSEAKRRWGDNASHNAQNAGP